jgi:LPXTG-site transpeptidase (sortase) family protein
MSGRRPAWIVLAVSLAAVLIGGVALLLVQRGGADDGVVASIGSRNLASIQAEVDSQSPSPATTPPTVEQSPVAGTPIPVHVKIPAIGVSTRVLPVGLDPSGATEIPSDITKVGWYDLGVAPGANQGSAVLIGHRDGVVQGHGVFYDLGSLSLGDTVIVLNSAGKQLTYKVVAREFIKKKKLPLDELFAIDGPPRLTLISCGGYYDRNNGGYQENVVVTAVQGRNPSA